MTPSEPGAHEIPTDWHGPALRPLAGGYSGETFVAGEGSDRVVVRIYTREPARAAVDASLLRLVRGLVPVPAVLELRLPTASTPAVLVTEYVEGTRLDVALAAGGVASDERLDLGVLGGSLANLLDTLAGIPFLRFAAFADADLTLASGPLPGDLEEWAERLRAAGRLATWPEADWQALLRLLDMAQTRLEDEASRRPARAVLTHSDLNPKNILVDPPTSQVVAVLDWEFAHAGSVHTDLGNLCRFERDPRFVEPLLAALRSGIGGDARERLRLGRAMDLWALLELAGRPTPGPVQELANDLLVAQARAGDLDAWPWDSPRMQPAPAGTG